MQSTQIVLAARPDGEPTSSDFDTVTVDLPPLEEGQVLLSLHYQAKVVASPSRVP